MSEGGYESMVISAVDELRHQFTDDKAWRESLWFCFQIPEKEIGAAIYYSYEPNLPDPRSNLTIYICKGMERRPNSSLYAFKRNFPLPESDFDDLRFGRFGSLRRIEPLKRWQLKFDDGERLQFDIEAGFYAGAWHYIDNEYPTPKYLAGDRYHRPWAVKGQLRLDGVTTELDHTGDSDHSWGRRLWEPLYDSKYVAAQCGREFALSLISARSFDGGTCPYGFVWDGTSMSAIGALECASDYGSDGIQERVALNVIDSESRLTRVEARSFAAFPAVATQEDGDLAFGRNVRSNDTYATFSINDGAHQGSGVLSWYWELAHYNKMFAAER